MSFPGIKGGYRTLAHVRQPPFCCMLLCYCFFRRAMALRAGM